MDGEGAPVPRKPSLRLRAHRPGPLSGCPLRGTRRRGPSPPSCSRPGARSGPDHRSAPGPCAEGCRRGTTALPTFVVGHQGQRTRDRGLPPCLSLGKLSKYENHLMCKVFSLTVVFCPQLQTSSQHADLYCHQGGEARHWDIHGGLVLSPSV
jgi:hypothetical protein